MRSLTRRPFLLIILSTLLSLSVAGDTLVTGSSLHDAGFLVSADGSFRLGFFTIGASNFRYLGIWYNKISVQTVVWVANRDRPLPPNSTAVLSFSVDASLVLSDSKGDTYWTTGATGLANPVGRLLNNSNFVVVSSGSTAAGSYAWQSFDYLTDSLLPGMRLGWDFRTGRNRNLTGWRSADDPATGENAMVVDVHGNPQIFLVRGSTPRWRAGPLVGKRFFEFPVTVVSDIFRFDFVVSTDEVYYEFNPQDSSVLARLVVDPNGRVQLTVWIESRESWDLFWGAPKDQCDTVDACGPFGVCSIEDSPFCSCLQGFDPRSPQDIPPDGCTRRTALDCERGTDRFVVVSGAKLPDTTAAVADGGMSLGECRAACLRNCSCTAYANADVTGGGSGCLRWGGDLTDLTVLRVGGQDLFVRLAAADPVLSSSHRRKVAAVTSVASVMGILLLGLIGWCVWGRKRRRKDHITVVRGITTSMSYDTNDDSKTGKQPELPQFDFRTIAAATENFSVENKLGKGGFGPVYKGRLAGGQEVAVKRLARNSVQGLDEFKNEVLLIAKLQHRNLVRLLGCCIEGEERMLVYEYMPNKSLDALLFDKTKGPLLDWKTRCQIVNGIARGLLYLHQDSRLRIIHRDLKAGNVLLDKEMNPKISDFGMARIFSGDETEVNTRRIVGTYGYMSPEYLMDGIFSVKSDVFSFGVLVLEIVSGKRNRGVYLCNPNLNLLGYTWSLWKEGNGLEVADSSMARSYPLEEVLKCITIGLLCVQERPEDRPTMASVVHMLANDTALLPRPRQPGFMAARSPLEGSSPPSKGELCTVNDVTLSMPEGR